MSRICFWHSLIFTVTFYCDILLWYFTVTFCCDILLWHFLIFRPQLCLWLSCSQHANSDFSVRYVRLLAGYGRISQDTPAPAGFPFSHSCSSHGQGHSWNTTNFWRKCRSRPFHSKNFNKIRNMFRYSVFRWKILRALLQLWIFVIVSYNIGYSQIL